MEHAVGHILTVLLVALFAVLFRTKPPALNSYQMSRLEEIGPSLTKYDNLVGLAIVLIGWPVLTVVFGGILFFILQLSNTYPGVQILFYFENEGVATTTGLIFAIGFSIPCSMYFLRNKYAQDFDMYLYYSYKHSGINYISLSRAWVNFFSIVGLVFLIFSSNYFFKINKDSIEFSRFLSLNTEHRKVLDVRGLIFSPKKKALNGDIVEHNRYRIIFKDNKDWVVDDWLKGNVTNDSLMKYLSKQTHLKIVNEPVSEW